jgi:very-short-patch-repair endonuclease
LGYWRRRRRFSTKKSFLPEGVSFTELRYRQIIQNKFPNQKLRFNDRITLGGLELDIYIPALKLAFEVNGPQHYRRMREFHKREWHFNQQMRRDFLKKQLCLKHGIKLVELNLLLSQSENMKMIDYAYKEIMNTRK